MTGIFETLVESLESDLLTNIRYHSDGSGHPHSFRIGSRDPSAMITKEVLL